MNNNQLSHRTWTPGSTACLTHPLLQQKWHSATLVCYSYSETRPNLFKPQSLAINCQLLIGVRVNLRHIHHFYPWQWMTHCRCKALGNSLNITNKIPVPSLCKPRDIMAGLRVTVIRRPFKACWFLQLYGGQTLCSWSAQEDQNKWPLITAAFLGLSTASQLSTGWGRGGVWVPLRS